jgi:hypothetical protein
MYRKLKSEPPDGGLAFAYLRTGHREIVSVLTITCPARRQVLLPDNSYFNFHSKPTQGLL